MLPFENIKCKSKSFNECIEICNEIEFYKCKEKFRIRDKHCNKVMKLTLTVFFIFIITITILIFKFIK